jgi:hypothetical protein
MVLKQSNHCLLLKQVLLDIPDAGAYYVYDGNSITTEEIRLFIQDYDDERLERRELQEDEEEGQEGKNSE